jgi:hypothetical protein
LNNLHNILNGYYPIANKFNILTEDIKFKLMIKLLNLKVKIYVNIIVKFLKVLVKNVVHSFGNIYIILHFRKNSKNIVCLDYIKIRLKLMFILKIIKLLLIVKINHK